MDLVSGTVWQLLCWNNKTVTYWYLLKVFNFRLQSDGFRLAHHVEIYYSLIAVMLKFGPHVLVRGIEG